MGDYPPLEALKLAADLLTSVDPRALSGSEEIVELYRQTERILAARARATAAFDVDAEWALAGARAAWSWLAVEANLSKPAAKRCVAQGRALRHLPAAEAAWLGGEITADHLRVLGAARTPKTQDVMARDEAVLVDQAKSLRFETFRQAVDYWLLLADPDGAERSDADKVEARSLRSSRSLNDMVVGNYSLDPINGAIFTTEHERLERQMFTSDWAKAKAALGRDPKASELGRTPGQRRADALVEMAIRSAAMAPGARRPQPLFSVVVGYESLRGAISELEDGTVLCPRTLLSWLDVALLERVVFDSASRPIDVGVRRRLFTGATRRAIEVRDRQCYDRYCDVPAGLCQGDHVDPWSKGGLTITDNGQMACGFHNRSRALDGDDGDDDDEDGYDDDEGPAP